MQLTLNTYFPKLALIEDPKNRLGYLTAAIRMVEVDSSEYKLLIEEVRRLARTFVN